MYQARKKKAREKDAYFWYICENKSDRNKMLFMLLLNSVTEMLSIIFVIKWLVDCYCLQFVTKTSFKGTDCWNFATLLLLLITNTFSSRVTNRGHTSRYHLEKMVPIFILFETTKAMPIKLLDCAVKFNHWNIVNIFLYQMIF